MTCVLEKPFLRKWYYNKRIRPAIPTIYGSFFQIRVMSMFWYYSYGLGGTSRSLSFLRKSFGFRQCAYCCYCNFRSSHNSMSSFGSPVRNLLKIFDNIVHFQCWKCVFVFNSSQAVCCKDHLHCCPEGTTCNSAAGKCDRGESSVSMTWFTKTAATPVREEKTSSAVLCPDGKGTCPEGSTCCLLASGQYGCCPLPKVAWGYRLINFCFLVWTWHIFFRILPRLCVAKITFICLLSSGQYGCCPLPKVSCGYKWFIFCFLVKEWHVF